MRYPDQDRAPIRPKQIRMSEVIQWTFRHRDTYPLPDGLDYSDLYYDVPDPVLIETKHFTNLSKTGFAERHLVAQSQVSRWINAGLPVREDGRIDVWKGDQWLEGYQARCARRRANGWQD